jgi:hypothetical protein
VSERPIVKRLLLAGTLMALSGCGLVATHKARDPRGALIGGNAKDLQNCAGVPDKAVQTTPDEMTLQWNVTSNAPAFQLSIAVLGSLKLGDSGSCKMVADVGRDGTIYDLAFPGATSSLTGGPYASCDQIVGECLMHPNSTQLPPSYDSFTYFLAAEKKP